MGTTSAKHELRGSPVITSVDFDFSKFEDLPNSKDREGFVFEPWMDEALKRFWMVKNQHAVAKLIGCSTNTCRDRYRELTENSS